MNHLLYLSIVKARESDAEGPAEGLVHECVDDGVDGRIGVYQVLRNGKENVVALQGRSRKAIRDFSYSAEAG